jgi:uncharacterized protein (TIGR03000 family)
MSRSNRMRLLTAVVLVGTVAACASQAGAWCGWRYCGAYCSPCWMGGQGCAPCYPVRCTSYCSVGCWSSCCSQWPSCCGYEVSCCDCVEPSEPAIEPTGVPPSAGPIPALIEPPNIMDPEATPPLPQPEAGLPLPEPEAGLPLPEPEAGLPRTQPETEPAGEPARTEAEVRPEAFLVEPAPALELPRPEANELRVPSRLPDEPPMPPRLEEAPGPAGTLPAPAPAAPAAPPVSSPSAGVVPDLEGTRGLIAIRVPAEARVFINGLETKSRGGYREYVSYGLKPGLTYKYEIRAEIARRGRPVQNTRTVYLRAGSRKRVAFRLEAEPDEAIAAL